MAAVALDALEHGLRLFRRFAVDAVEDQFGVAEDGVERRAQLVAHVGEELRLVLARHRELLALLLDLAEQPRVLDRHHRLVGEGLQQVDGGLRKFAGRLAPHHQRADDVVGTEQRHDQQRAEALAQVDLVDRRGRLVLDVGDLDRLALASRPADVGVAGADAPVGDRDDHLLAHAVGGAQPELLPRLVEHVDRAGVGARELHRALHDGGQHLFEVERRVDRLGDFAQRLQLADRAGEVVGAGAQLVEQADVLDGDDGLGGEVGDQLDLLVGERPDLLAVDADCADQLLFPVPVRATKRSRAAELSSRDPSVLSAESRSTVATPSWFGPTRFRGGFRVRYFNDAALSLTSNSSGRPERQCCAIGRTLDRHRRGNIWAEVAPRKSALHLSSIASGTRAPVRLASLL